MGPITFEEAVGYLGVYIFIMFIAFSMAVGLYYLADLVEEHLKLTKKVIHYTVLGTIVTLLGLWVIHGVSYKYIVPSVLAQLSHLRLLKPFPFISLSDPGLFLSMGLAVVSHILWMMYHMGSYHHLATILGFFLVAVWLVPFGFIISLAANENVLPGVSSGMPSSYYQDAPQQGLDRGQRGKATRTMLSRWFDVIRKKGSAALPNQKTRVV